MRRAAFLKMDGSCWLLPLDGSADFTGDATIPFQSQAYAATTDEDFPDFLYDFYMSYCIDP